MEHGREAYANPIQRRVSELKEQRRGIDAELRQLRERLRVGVCELCGKEFVRARVTKRYCSQNCTIKASPSRATSYDLPAIAQNIDLLEASGFMTPRSMEVIRVLADKRNTHSVSDLIGVSHQRVSQIASKATRIVKMLHRLKAAMQQT